MPRKVDPGLSLKLSYKQLISYTDNFSDENFLGSFQFGKLYRGSPKGPLKPVQHVMVKIWDSTFRGENEARVMDEIVLLQHERMKSHPGMIDMYGYCWDNEHLCVVYDVKPLDTLHNLVPKDSFTWLQRIKVALGFARLLKFLHAGNPEYKPFLVRNIAAAHIVLDEQYNPKLIDFGMITGGLFADRRETYELCGTYGNIDPCLGLSAKWSKKTDMFAFGVLLLNLISKRVYAEEESSGKIYPIYYWAWGLYQPSDPGSDTDSSKSDSEADNRIKKPIRTLVDRSLAMSRDFHPMDGERITRLAMKCINSNANLRPTMKQVMRSLRKLQVLKEHAEFLGSGVNSPIKG